MPPAVELMECLRQSEARIEQLRQQGERLQQENEKLRHILQLLLKKQYATGQGEKIDPRQLELLLGKEASVLVETMERAKEQALVGESKPEPVTRRISLPEDCVTEEVVLEPAEVSAAPEQWKRIGEEVTEEIDIEPAKVIRRRIIRPRYVHRVQREVAPVIAPLPQRLIERSPASAGLIAHLLVAKYVDHLPLYRQEKIFRERYGLRLPRRAMCDWVHRAVGLLKPIYQHICQSILAHGYMQVDETPISYLDPDAGIRHARKGFMWAFGFPDGDMAFAWNPRRSAEALGAIIGNYRLLLQCDAYAAYGSFAKSRGATLLGCWAHVRRKVHESLATSPFAAAVLLRQIQHLYRIEKELRRSRAGPNLRVAVRHAQSLPVLRRIRAYAEVFQRRSRPNQPIGEACRYLINQWELLVRYIDHGVAEIDNNLTENAIRPSAIGKKNWLFIGSPEAGETCAIIYTIIETCRRHNIEPAAYLRDVLQRIPATTNQEIHKLVPKVWKKQQQQARKVVAPSGHQFVTNR
jgi:transposase